MKIVLLSGGKGKRLWPASTDEMPKQFISIFKDSTSMLKKTYNLILEKNNKKDIYIATCKKYEKKVKNVINDFNNLIVEPVGIGTFGAIINIAVYLSEVESCSPDEVVSVVPTDHEVDNNFYDTLFEAEEKIKNNNHDICLVGIEPTFPSNQYGYIINNKGTVKSFKEKPSEKDAIELISNNALWNSGVVVFRLNKILEITSKYCDFKSYNKFIEKYTSLPHTSFDVEVLEKEDNKAIVKTNLLWSDLGLWETLAPKISEADQYNTNIVNFEDKKIVNDGIKNAIIINSVNGIKLIQKKQNKNLSSDS